MLYQDFVSDAADWLLNHGLKIAIVITATIVGLKLLHAFINKVVRQAVDRTLGVREGGSLDKRVDTLDAVFYAAVKVVAWLVVGMVILSELNIEIGPLLAAAGVTGLAFGFGGQYLIRDIISGLFILLEDQFRVGDVVRVAGIAGLVENITLRKTTLRDLDGIEHHVPNGEITTASNLTKLWSRAHMDIGISYDSDLEKATRILNRIGRQMASEEPWKDDISKAIESLGVEDFADSAIIIKVLGDTKPMRQWDVMREYRKRVKIAFDQEGIEIPYPHRTIIQKK